MKDQNRKIANFLAFMVLLLLVAGFQTSFWPLLFGSSVAPNAVLLVLMYMALYRDLPVVVASVYFGCILFRPFSAEPLSHLLFSFMCTSFVAHFIRVRISWTGLSYFLIQTAVMTFVFRLSLFFTVYNSEWPMWDQIPLKATFFELLMAPVFSTLIYSIGQWIDHVLPVPTVEVSEV